MELPNAKLATLLAAQPVIVSRLVQFVILRMITFKTLVPAQNAHSSNVLTATTSWNASLAIQQIYFILMQLIKSVNLAI